MAKIIIKTIVGIGAGTFVSWLTGKGIGAWIAEDLK